MTSVVQRYAGVADVAELVRLRQIIFEGHPAQERQEWLEPCARFFEERLARRDSTFCVTVLAEEQEGGRLFASAVGWVDDHLPSPVSESGALGYVGSVTTDHGYRGQGFGAKVFGALMQWFIDQNIPRVELQTTPDAVALYKKQGFEELPTPVLRWYASRVGTSVE